MLHGSQYDCFRSSAKPQVNKGSTEFPIHVQVWDLREGQLFYTLHGHEGATYGVDFSPAGDFFASGGADEQVLVWRTNFDRVMADYVLTSVQPNPRLATTYPTAAVTVESPKPASAAPLLRISRGLEGGGGAGPPASRTRSPTRQVPTIIASEPCHSMPTSTSAVRPAAADAALDQGSHPEHRWSCDSAEECQDSEQSGAFMCQETDGDGSHEVFIPPPMNLADLPPALSATLQHIVGQLDVLTQTMGLLEERLTISEDKMHRLDKGLQSLNKQSSVDSNSSPKVHIA